MNDNLHREKFFFGNGVFIYKFFDKYLLRHDAYNSEYDFSNYYSISEAEVAKAEKSEKDASEVIDAVMKRNGKASAEEYYIIDKGQEIIE